MMTDHNPPLDQIPDGTPVLVDDGSIGVCVLFKRADGFSEYDSGHPSKTVWPWGDRRVVDTLHRASECPAPVWRRVDPQDVRDGWRVRLTSSDGRGAVEGPLRDCAYVLGFSINAYVNAGWTLWTSEPEPVDPDADLVSDIVEAMIGAEGEMGASLEDYARAALAEVRRAGEQ